MKRLRSQWLFFAMLASFATIYLAFYPATFAIADECEILTLAYSIAHGTIHPDAAGVKTYNESMEFAARGHRVVKYSAFHAALLAPAIDANWRLAFLVSAGFFVAGAFAVRAMLLEDGISSDWAALYFFLPGMLYYASSLEAAVPAAAMGLVGVAMLARKTPRPIVGGLAMGAAVLLHPWMAAAMVPLAAVWSVERISAGRIREAIRLGIGAFPTVIALGGFYAIVNGSAVRANYAVTGEVFRFGGEHFSTFLPFYLVSLAIFPTAGWAALSPRYAKGWAVPAAVGAVVLGASLYQYRDGLTSGLPGVAALVAGAIPGQRFLLPASVLACVPAARFLETRLRSICVAWGHPLRAAVLIVFVAGYGAIAALHQSFLRANAAVQIAIAGAVPSGALLLGNGEILKELAPVRRIVAYREISPRDSDAARGRGAYVAWITAPGATPPAAIFSGRRVERVQARSWVWNRDLWIGYPSEAPEPRVR